MGWAQRANKNPDKGKEKFKPTSRREISLLFNDLGSALALLAAMKMRRRARLPILREGRRNR